MNILLVDNYDSFTYNLYHLIRKSRKKGVNIEIVKNDALKLEDVSRYDKLILSPGAGIPATAGMLLPLLREYGSRKSILGICLGHQAIGEVYGAKLINLAQVYHGVSTLLHPVDSSYMFQGLGEDIQVGRYHSWALSEDDFPACLSITSKSEDGAIMSISHKHYDVQGLQFHPESILTPQGLIFMSNFLNR